MERWIVAGLRPAQNPAAAASVIWMLIVCIALADYLVGLDISLAVLYLVPVSLATGWFGRGYGIVVVAISIGARVASDWLIVWPGKLPFPTCFNVAATTLISLFFVVLLDALLRLYRGIEIKVQERTAQLREAVAHQERLEREILDVGSRERGAIGRELHDELGQHLTATALGAQALAEELGERPEAARAHAIVTWIEEATMKARKLARGLLLAEIAPARLPQELEELALGSNAGGVATRFVFRGRTLTANGAACAQLFRIAQESVANALRHAEPTKIDVLLASDEDAVCLMVGDNGRGFSPESVNGSGYGTQIMKHRARIIGASLSVVSTPGAGTQVICRLPTGPLRMA